MHHKIIEKMKLDELPSKSCPITIRFTAVNPANTNINAGMFSMNTDLVIVDYEGNMLDENGVWKDLNNGYYKIISAVNPFISTFSINNLINKSVNYTNFIGNISSNQYISYFKIIILL